MWRMTKLSRKTINFDHAAARVVAPFLVEDSAEHAALERIVGERLASDSAELRALVLLGVGRVREALLEDAYNEAVDAGDFDDTRTWVEQTTGARRRRRASA
jgi:formate dehydrogenase assembly factor FdhD